MSVEPRIIAGVPTYVVTPPEPVPAENGKRVLINLHGGAYIVNGGRNTVLVHLLRVPVIAVDYRMPPDHPFPAALDDALAVYREVVGSHDPATVGVYGTSAGGGLAAATMLKARTFQPAVAGCGRPRRAVVGPERDGR